MRHTCLATIEGLVFDPEMPNLLFDEGIEFLHPGSEAIMRLIETDEVKRSLGGIHLRTLTLSPMLLFIFDLERAIDRTGSNVPGRALQIEISDFDRLLNCFWFVKDCCISLGTIFAFEDGTNIVDVLYLNEKLSNSNGSSPSVKIGMGEIELAFEAYEMVSNAIEEDANHLVEDPNLSFGTNSATSSDLRNLSTKNFNRLHRCWQMISSARRESYLVLKITFYCAALECLFTSSDFHVKHKLMNRASKYVGQNDVDIEWIKESVSLMFRIRSSYMHGYKLPVNDSYQRPIDFEVVAKRIDCIMRRIVYKAFTDGTSTFFDGKQFDRLMCARFQDCEDIPLEE